MKNEMKALLDETLAVMQAWVAQGKVKDHDFFIIFKAIKAVKGKHHLRAKRRLNRVLNDSYDDMREFDNALLALARGRATLSTKTVEHMAEEVLDLYDDLDR